VGEWVLELDGTAPYHAAKLHGRDVSGPLTPAVATLSADAKSIHLIIANGSWTKAVPCRVGLRNFQAARATGVALSHSDPDGKPLLERKEDAIAELPVAVAEQDIRCTIPQHSVVFVTVEGR
jgi:alpha-L-arabinofuranosidase